jgi:hypothetical protein
LVAIIFLRRIQFLSFWFEHADTRMIAHVGAAGFEQRTLKRQKKDAGLRQNLG